MTSIRAFINETSIYGLGNAFSRVFSMLLIPLYASYLGKIDYANLIMLQSGFSVLSFILVLNSGVFYYYYDTGLAKERRSIFSSWFYYQIGIGIIILLITFVLSPSLSKLFIATNNSRDQISNAIPLLALQFLPYAYNITNINLYRVQRKPFSVVKIVLLEAVLMLAFTSVGLHFMNFGLTEVIGAQCMAKTVVALVFWRDGKYYLPFRLVKIGIIRKLVLFSWPFFIISGLSWTIVSIDKYLGAAFLNDVEDVAYLALAMQLTIPIVILSDMIRMAIGPYVMSIQKAENAEGTYQRVFDLSVFIGLAVSISIISSTPLLTKILADSSYYPVLRVVPLISLSSILSLMANQIAISFSLANKNSYLLYGSIAGSVIGIISNIILMPIMGYVASGIAQLASYVVMGSILYAISKRKTNSELNPSNSIILICICLPFIVGCVAFYKYIIPLGICTLFPIGALFIVSLTTAYLRQQGTSLTSMLKQIRLTRF